MIGETKLSEHLHSAKLAQPKRIWKSAGNYQNGQRATSLTRVRFRKWLSSTMCWIIEGEERIKKHEKIQAIIESLNPADLERIDPHSIPNEYFLTQSPALGTLGRTMILEHGQYFRVDDGFTIEAYKIGNNIFKIPDDLFDELNDHAEPLLSLAKVHNIVPCVIDETLTRKRFKVFFSKSFLYFQQPR